MVKITLGNRCKSFRVLHMLDGLLQTLLEQNKLRGDDNILSCLLYYLYLGPFCDCLYYCLYCYGFVCKSCF